MNVGCRDTADSLNLTGIWPEKIEATKRRIKIGAQFTLMDTRLSKDEFSALCKARVTAKYPHIVCFDNGMSATYAQMAMYYRKTDKWRCIV